VVVQILQILQLIYVRGQVEDDVSFTGHAYLLTHTPSPYSTRAAINGTVYMIR